MSVRRNELATGLLAGTLFVAYAAVSHYLVGINKTGTWVHWLYLLQHVGINLVLGLMFGRSLTGGREPLVTTVASLVHEVMTPVLLRYTRQVTVAWTIFFFAMAVVSILLFLLAPIGVWSVFANILTLPLVALMFIAENEVRKRILPAEDQIGILGALRAFRANFRS